VRDLWSKILGSYGFQNWDALATSLAPSLKLPGVGAIALVISSISVSVIEIFGLDWLAFLSLLVIFSLELASGLLAGKLTDMRSEAPSPGLLGFLDSWKLSRFTFKCSFYLVLIGISYLMSVSFEARGKSAAAVIFDYMHMFFTVQIVIENVVSIAKNIGVISGDSDSHWLTRLVKKINSMLE
jgi:hypothetical protein